MTVPRSLARIERALLDGPGSPLDELRVIEKDERGVSIVIPTWNHRDFVLRAIRSARAGLDALAERGIDGEVILIDDASRDGSQKVIRSLEVAISDPRLSTVLLEANLGLPRVRNLGLAAARYRYALLLDVDNELEPANLPTFYESIRTTGAAIVYGVLLVRENGRVTGLRSAEPVSGELYEENFIDAFCLVDAERVLALGGYATTAELAGWEDWELVLHLVGEEEQVVFVPVVMGWYDRVAHSMSRELRELKQARLGTVQRMFAPAGPRSWVPVPGRVYHPATGTLAEAGAANTGAAGAV